MPRPQESPKKSPKGPQRGLRRGQEGAQVGIGSCGWCLKRKRKIKNQKSKKEALGRSHGEAVLGVAHHP
tara:strand:+ start:155 stop:361 length:207 start_codon:yes stop_codon:yes gene_type:complete